MNFSPDARVCDGVQVREFKTYFLFNFNSNTKIVSLDFFEIILNLDFSIRKFKNHILI